MRTFSLGFFGGTLILLMFYHLPGLGMSLIGGGVVLLIAGFCYFRAHYKTALGLLALTLGFSWALWYATQLNAARIMPEREGQDIIVEGVVAGIPEYSADGLRFALQVDESHLEDSGTNAVLSGTVKIGWYRHFPEGMQAGQRWRLMIRAKQPNGFMNPGGFDYEKWLFSQRITAVAYVRKSPENKVLGMGFAGSIDRSRHAILTAIQNQLVEHSMQGIVAALAVAWRADISTEQWEVLRRTGTSHLVAISGLHIGLVAGFGVLLTGMAWWLFPALYLSVPLRIAGGVTGAVLALGYALLAGLTLPTQRALVIVLVIMIGVLYRRSLPFIYTLALALFAVLLIDPLASLSAGFWLSFLSVLMIFLLSQRSIRRKSKWLVIIIQLGLSLGMIPLTASLFGSVSLVSAPANLIAVPVVSLLVVPLVLLGVVLLPLSEWLAGIFWELAALVLEYAFGFLSYLSDLDWAALNLPQLPLPWVLVSMLGFLVLILPKGVPGRWLGLVLIAPVFLWQPERPPAGAFRLTTLDVGQGLAAAIETHEHVLVFDTGPKPSEGFDAGRLVVLPWLYAQGHQKLDALVVSHADNDHSGGAGAVLSSLSVGRLLSGADGLLAGFGVEPLHCLAGQRWQWDGVSFEVMHPSPDFSDKKRNNRSCVLRVSNGHHSVLLTGDIERRAEYVLARQLKGRLQADVLIVPHHGSKSSSSPAFLKRVDPQLAIVTAGYRNRFHHPHPSVVKRYQDWNIDLLNTVDSGAIRVRFPAGDEAFVVERYRDEKRGFWNR